MGRPDSAEWRRGDISRGEEKSKNETFITDEERREVEWGSM